MKILYLVKVTKDRNLQLENFLRFRLTISEHPENLLNKLDKMTFHNCKLHFYHIGVDVDGQGIAFI
jgi:hypothetical protein